MTATMEDLFARLDALGIAHSTITHPPLFTVEESQSLRGEIAGAHAKNLFLKDKKGRLWLVVAREELPVDLKRLDRVIGSARLSFGRAELLEETLGIKPGSVTPFALINDPGLKVTPVFDRGLVESALVNFHPLTNEATTTISSEALMTFVKGCGHTPVIVDLPVRGEGDGGE
ncbi:MAG: prolyl-tRNA synthetase associated domain-containing protein [Rhodobiaceae bacterium]|nr:prolyl-tRNA synthetase associated domain-containing protein [Rhodobiaceae bacterium]